MGREIGSPRLPLMLFDEAIDIECAPESELLDRCDQQYQRALPSHLSVKFFFFQLRSVSSKCSFALPSTMMAISPTAQVRSANTSFCDGREPPARPTIYSGIAIFNSASCNDGSMAFLNSDAISSGIPLALSQESAVDMAEKWGRQCLSGSASNLFHDSGPLVGTSIRFCFII